MTRARTEQTHESGDVQFLTAFYQLLVSAPVRGDEHNLGVPLPVDRRHKSYDIRSPSPLLRVPETHALLRDVVVDEGGDCASEGFQLIRTDPDQEPTVILDTS
jgi:hypothetical protein